jgi:UDP-galactopyranose mutase
MRNVIVVGSGWSGAVIAREVAVKMNCSVTIVEKRGHIAGNMYDEYDEHGILVQKYGIHTLYSNNYATFEYVLPFCELYDSPITSKTWVDGRWINSPYNFRTMIDLIGLKKAAELIGKMRERYGFQKSVSTYDLISCDDTDICEFGNLLFEKVYRNYIATMWGKAADSIDRSVVDRTQFMLDFQIVKGLDFNYNPISGYTKLFEKLLSHENITIELNTDALPHITLAKNQVLYDGEIADCLVFTGPLDELFGCCFGALPYRSLDIHYEWFNTDGKLPVCTTYYPQGNGYMRKNEFRKIMYDDSKCVGTIVSTEYPQDYDKNIGNEPYYPVLTEESRATFAKYAELAKSHDNLFTVGRLADFKYYDMWKSIEHAQEVAKSVIAYLKK